MVTDPDSNPIELVQQVERQYDLSHFRGFVYVGPREAEKNGLSIFLPFVLR